MPKGVYNRNPGLKYHCKNCGRRLPNNGKRPTTRKWCASCKEIRVRAQSCASRERQSLVKDRPRQAWSEASYLTAGGATQRQFADDTLDRGGQHRRCQLCGRLYTLDKFDSPCPSCQSHLIPLPGGPYEES